MKKAPATHELMLTYKYGREDTIQSTKARKANHERKYHATCDAKESPSKVHGNCVTEADYVLPGYDLTKVGRK